jgi:hypothetical protein
MAQKQKKGGVKPADWFATGASGEEIVRVLGYEKRDLRHLGGQTALMR